MSFYSSNLNLQIGIYSLLNSQGGKRVVRLIFDEAQEYLGLHAACAGTFGPMLERLAKTGIQRVFVTAMLPVRLEGLFLKNVGLDHKSPTHIIIHSPSVRPELAHHVTLCPPSIPSTSATVNLTRILRGKLVADERMIIFVLGIPDAKDLSQKLRCDSYHAQLGHEEHAACHQKWVDGENRAIVATTALIQGIDLEFVRFVVFHNGTYGLISYYQGAGRGGRSGSQCDVFTVMKGNVQSVDTKGPDVEARREWKEFVEHKRCRLQVVTSCFDGMELSCGQIDNQ